MIETAAQLALTILALSMVLGTWRLLRGPDAVDRVLALDTLYINAIALLIAYGVYVGSSDFVEPALLIALLGFVGTVSLARALLRRRLVAED